MARLVYQTLVRSSSKSWSFMCMSPRILTTHRHESNQSGKRQPQLIEVDLDSSSSPSDGEVLGIKKLEDVIHNIIVKRSAPDWLPFIPGSSYWVPPPRTRRRQGGVVDVLGKLANYSPSGLSDEESLSLSTVNGWPSSSFYFFQENSSTRPVPVEMKVEVTAERDSDKEPQSEDEE
ncbi:Serine/arginine repetitive matrix protein [Heracleum sosnowskyi]|uniref:Serine/arginine repetitive matrix protein n=1 Tax=Heracleum sosnowskyi TaxID=360622 RepID=A0AAD8GMK9_9APIA|nr:Serine/arginine repetitive matrix protein [Heracleum sosnowskyi]